MLLEIALFYLKDSLVEELYRLVQQAIPTFGSKYGQTPSYIVISICSPLNGIGVPFFS